MTDEKRIAAAMDAVEKFKEKNSLSQEKAGKLIGVAGAVLSQLRAGKYTGDVNRQIKIIEDYFALKNEAEQTYSEVEYAETSISSKVYSIIRLCRIKGGLASFSGDAGIGKTKAAEKYLRDNPDSTVFITLNPCFKSIKSLLKLIAVQMGVRRAGGIDDLWTAIRERISDGTVWIFDEAQHLTYNAIEVIRSFSDDCTSKGKTLGICLIGNIDTNRKLSMFAQLDSRTKLKPTCTTAKIKREDICMLIPLLEKQNMNAEIDFLWQISRTKQALRGAVTLFGQAYDNGDYTLNGLVKMAKSMEMDLTGLNIRKAKGAA
ncbi:MAG: AAA family ATPase [Ruminococcus sp.]|nr:AAA family ATPase [Ruminococcus sp.]